MKLRTRILSYLLIVAAVSILWYVGAPDTGGYGTAEGWTVYILCAAAACGGFILAFEVLHRMWRR
jgi:hypothetical protein